MGGDRSGSHRQPYRIFPPEGRILNHSLQSRKRKDVLNMKNTAEIKEILLKQLQLVQEACERKLLPEEAARLSEALSSAVTIALSIGPKKPLNL